MVEQTVLRKNMTIFEFHLIFTSFADLVNYFLYFVQEYINFCVSKYIYGHLVGAYFM